MKQNKTSERIKKSCKNSRYYSSLLFHVSFVCLWFVLFCLFLFLFFYIPISIIGFVCKYTIYFNRIYIHLHIFFFLTTLIFVIFFFFVVVAFFVALFFFFDCAYFNKVGTRTILVCLFFFCLLLLLIN